LSFGFLDEQSSNLKPIHVVLLVAGVGEVLPVAVAAGPHPQAGVPGCVMKTSIGKKFVDFRSIFGAGWVATAAASAVPKGGRLPRSPFARKG
jgi:hypothetical protein